MRAERTAPDARLDRQREVVDAFYAASQAGDFHALLAVLDPDVVLRSGSGRGHVLELRGAEAVATRAHAFSRLGLVIQPARVNGAAGAVATRDGRPFSVACFTVRDGKIVEMDFLADAERLADLDLAMVSG